MTAVQVAPVTQPQQRSAWQRDYARFNAEQIAHLEAATDGR